MNDDMNVNPNSITGETKLCRHCKMTIPIKAKVCPHCRRKQKSGILRWIVIIAIAFLFFCIVVSAIYDSKLKTAANEIGKAYATSNEIFSNYDVTSEDGGYRINVYANKAYGESMYMSYILKGISEDDYIAATNVYNWEYYNDNVLTTYEGFYYALAAKMYTEVYEDVLNTYTDYLNDYMDQMKDLFN